MRDEFPDAIIMKPSEMFGKEDRFFNHYASKTIEHKVHCKSKQVQALCSLQLNQIVIYILT